MTSELLSLEGKSYHQTNTSNCLDTVRWRSTLLNMQKIKTLNIEYNEIKYRCLVEVWGVIQECIVVEYLASCTMHNMRCN